MLISVSYFYFYGGVQLELKETCLKKTLLFLSERGLKFTMNDLAKELGISKKTLYQMFESKEDLLIQVADSCFDDIKKSEKMILSEENLSTKDKLKKLVIALPDGYRGLNWYRIEELNDKYPSVYRRVQERLETDWDKTLNLIEKGIREGDLRPINLPVFKAMLEGAMEHFLTGSELKENNISYGDALDMMIDIMMDGVVAKEVKE